MRILCIQWAKWNIFYYYLFSFKMLLKFRSIYVVHFIFLLDSYSLGRSVLFVFCFQISFPGDFKLRKTLEERSIFQKCRTHLHFLKIWGLLDGISLTHVAWEKHWTQSCQDHWLWPSRVVISSGCVLEEFWSCFSVALCSNQSNIHTA